jgi:hypothetical protein
MATDREIQAAYDKAKDPKEIDGVWVQPGDEDKLAELKKAQEEAEKAAEASVPRVSDSTKSNTAANKARTAENK